MKRHGKGERKINMDPYIGEIQMVGFNFGTLAKLYVGNHVTALLQLDLSTLLSGITSSQVASAALTVFMNRVNSDGLVNWSGSGREAKRKSSNRWGSRR
jgi:hypothetical protein